MPEIVEHGLDVAGVVYVLWTCVGYYQDESAFFFNSASILAGCHIKFLKTLLTIIDIILQAQNRVEQNFFMDMIASEQSVL
jgi:hypothetical protein